MRTIRTFNNKLNKQSSVDTDRATRLLQTDHHFQGSLHLQSNVSLHVLASIDFPLLVTYSLSALLNSSGVFYSFVVVFCVASYILLVYLIADS